MNLITSFSEDAFLQPSSSSSSGDPFANDPSERQTEDALFGGDGDSDKHGQASNKPWLT